jgi:hypothetical protein
MKQILNVEQFWGHKIYYTHIGELKVFIYDKLVKFDNGVPYVELPLLTAFKKISERSIMIFPVDLLS